VVTVTIKASRSVAPFSLVDFTVCQSTGYAISYSEYYCHAVRDAV
jgi:hypothetical protein